MSDEVVYNHAPKTEECVETATAVVTEPEAVEKSDRGLFDMFGKKKEEEKCEEAAISSEFDQKVQVSEPEPEKKEGFLAKLHRTGSSSSSSSDEECDENGEKKKKKKPLKEKKEETYVPIEKYDETPVVKTEPEEKKGLMEKIKEKLPGGHKKVEGEEHAAPPPTPVVVAHDGEGEQKEKKGIFEKIKEKIPGYHSKSEEEKEKEKEKVKECD